MTIHKFEVMKIRNADCQPANSQLVDYPGLKAENAHLHEKISQMQIQIMY